MSEQEELKQVEAVYFSALAVLDEIPSYNRRAQVVMNWVKYIASTEAERRHPGDIGRFAEEFNGLCLDFAEAAMTLSETFIKVAKEYMKQKGCGTCPQCIARKAAEAAQQQAKN